MLLLGETIIEELDDDMIKINQIFMEVDFLDRTVMKLITIEGYECLLKHPKTDALLDELWVGKSSYECDGRITDFSMLSYLWGATIKKLQG
jgi:hypothetical protein